MLLLEDEMNKAILNSFLASIQDKDAADRYEPDGIDALAQPKEAQAPCGYSPAPGLSRKPLPILPDGVVTLMVRNIPARYDQELLLQEWIPDGTFDMLHIPFGVDLRRSKGYCFVNCVSHEAALDFQRRVHGTRLKLQKGKPLTVGAAAVQGREENLKAFRARALAYMPYFEMVPAFFEGKERLSTPEVLQLLGQTRVASKLTRLRELPMQVVSL